MLIADLGKMEMSVIQTLAQNKTPMLPGDWWTTQDPLPFRRNALKGPRLNDSILSWTLYL